MGEAKQMDIVVVCLTTIFSFETSLFGHFTRTLIRFFDLRELW